MSFCARDTFHTLKERKLSVVLIFCFTRHINGMCTHVAHKTWNFFPKKIHILELFLGGNFSSFWSYFQIWVSYMHIIAYDDSYDIIGQKSSIGQKFLPSRAPPECQKNHAYRKYFVEFLLILHISTYVAGFRRAESSKFLTDRWFLDYDAKWCCWVKQSCQNHFFMIFYTQT